MGRRDRAGRVVVPCVVIALVASLVVLAVRHEGFRETRVALNDAGIWVTNRDIGDLGRVNTQIKAIEVRTPTPSDLADVAQVDDTVVLFDAKKAVMVGVDVALARANPGATQKIPKGSQVLLGGPAGAIVDRSSGRAWLVPRRDLGTTDVQEAPAVVEAGKGVVGALGIDGRLHVLRTSSGELTEVGLGGEPETSTVEGDLEGAQVTSVGDQAVVLDKRGRVIVPGRGSVDLPDGSSGAILQVPGPEASEVLVATDAALLAVPLAGGSARVVHDGGTGGPAAPVRLGPCTYGAWADRPTYVQACEGTRVRSGEVPGAGSGAVLTFRVNRGRVLINDQLTGTNLLFDDDEEPIVVDNWDEALNEDDRNDQERETSEVEQQQSRCEQSSKAPEAVPDEAGTRPGRPVVVPVLDNDRADPCDVLAVELPGKIDPKVATVDVVDGGAALQVTPAAGATGVVEVPYVARGRGGRASSNLSVQLVPEGQNTAPLAVLDRTVVDSGRAVSHDVLANDRDPDGDALTLVRVVAEKGVVQFEADGMVRFTSDDGFVGMEPVRYVVRDEAGEEKEGTLEVQVQAAEGNLAPKARNDRLVAFVGKEARLDILANDTDPDGDALTVNAVKLPASLNGAWDPKGSVSVTPSDAGTYYVDYQISDISETSDARIRVDVLDTGDNSPPVAVRDDLVVRPGTPALADLVANDLDAEGDPLAIARVEADPASPLSIEVLEMRLVRVTASAELSRTQLVRYWVSDGSATVPGVLVVRPFDGAGVDQPPLVEPDEVTVRAGGVVSVPVLRNDRDPEGERLSLVGVGAMAAGKGTVFGQGDELRFQAPDGGAATLQTTYTVTDPGGNKVDGRVTFRVIAADAPNRPPLGPSLVLRAQAERPGSVRVRLLDADPDGDLVAIVGVDAAPKRGRVTIDGALLAYTPDRGAVGADSFTFTMRDTGGLTATGRVRVVIVPAADTNTPPVAVPDRVTVGPGSERVIAVLDNDRDADGDPIELLTKAPDAPTKPAIGSIEIDGDRIVYRVPDDVEFPPEEDKAYDSFTYGITDGLTAPVRGLVTATIQKTTPDNLPPLARDDFTAVQDPGATVNVKVLANDTDPDDPDPSFKISVPDDLKAVIRADGSISVTVGERSLSFVYELTDADGDTARAVVQIPVFKPEKLPPVAVNDRARVRAGEPVTINVLENDRDPAERKLELVSVGASRGGQAVADSADGKVTFTAAADATGDGGFNYVVSNGELTATGSVAVTIEGIVVNRPPTFQRTSAIVAAGSSVSVDLGRLAADPDPDDVLAFSGGASTNPKVRSSLQGTTLTIDADDDAKGVSVAIPVRVSDGELEATSSVDVTVSGNDGPPPQAVDDVARTTQGVAVEKDVVANDVDPLRKGLTLSVLSVDGGAASASGRVIRFTPDAAFFGVGLVRYSVQDATGDPARTSAAVLRVTVVGKPSAPSAPSGTTESTLVKLSWGAPANNGGPITGYVVEADVGGISRKVTSTSADIDGLTNGTAYRFRVAAENEAGTGPFSAFSSPLTPDELPGIPGAPTAEWGDGQASVSWTPPTNRGSPVTGYLLRTSPGGQTVEVGGQSTSTTVSALTNGTAYTFSIAARNAVGLTDFSAPSAPVVPAGKPLAPTSVSAQRLDSDVTVGRSATVTWVFDDAAQGNGDPASAFTITANPGGGTQSVSGSARTATFSSLTNGTSYTFSVTATNKAGIGAAATSNPVTPASVPGAPSGLSGTPRDRSADFTWSPPSTDGGSPITYYELQVGFESNMNPQNCGTSTACTAANLTNGATYEFRVAACNQLGCGASSNAVQVVPFGDPFTPSVNVDVQNQNLHWTWSDPGGNGRPVTHYILYLDNAVIDANYTGTTFDRSFGFGEQHTLGVSAVNSEGNVGNRGSATGTTASAPGSVQVSKGSPVSASDCSTSACAHVRVTFVGLAPGNHAVQCWGSQGGDSVFYSYSTSSVVSEVCYFGYTGSDVWAIVDGTYVSNRLTW